MSTRSVLLLLAGSALLALAAALILLPRADPPDPVAVVPARASTGSESPASAAALQKILQRARETVVSATGFDQAQTLDKLEADSRWGTVYRFEKDLTRAWSSFRSQRRDDPPDPLISLEFEGHDPTAFCLAASGSKVRLAQGCLRIGSGQWEELVTDSLLDLPKDQIAEIAIRLRHSRGGSLVLGWEQRQSPAQGRVVLEVLPGNEFRTYHVDARKLLDSFPGQRVDSITLRPQGQPVKNEVLEIDSIHLLEQRYPFSQLNYGEVDHRVARERRKTIFIRSPGTLRFSIDAAEEQTLTLGFGLAVLRSGAPVEYRIGISSGGSQDQELSGVVSDPSRWQDRTVELSPGGTEVELSFETQSDDENILFWSNPVLYGRPAQRMNVLVILEDALRADHMSLYGYHRETTPFKARLAERGTRFVNCFSQAAKTRMSVASLVTSLYPTASGVWNLEEVLHPSFLTLAEIMRSQGFVTGAMVLNPHAGAAAGLHQGYSFFFDPLEDRADRVFGQRAVQWIDDHLDRNFLLYLHIMDPHGVYDPPRELRKWHREPDPAERILEPNPRFDPDWADAPTAEGRRALYDGEIAFNDRELERLVDALQSRDLVEHTLIVLVADHGEHLGEHLLWGHIQPGYLQVLRTPMLMLYPPAIPAGQVITQNVQNLDLVPTILDLAGIGTDGLLLQGDSLSTLLRGQNLGFWNDRAVVSEALERKRYREHRNGNGSWFHQDRHFLHAPPVHDKIFVFPSDPQEQEPIRASPQLGDVSRRFFDELQEHNLAIWNSVTSGADGEIDYDPETVEFLRALGYL